jgi:hypothetical protein
MGTTVVKAPYFDEALVITEIDFLKLKHARIHTTLLSDEKIELVTEELKRIADSTKDY